MAATSFGDANLVWQKVFQSLSQQGTTVTGAANPASQNAFRALKLQMSTQKLNPNLQYFPFAEADVNIASSGFTGPTGAFTLYGAWAKKTNTGTTLSFLQLRNQINTTYGTGATGVQLCLRFSGVGDENFFISPSGLPITQTTGSGLAVNTAINGGTSSNLADSVHGFLILGA